MRAAISSVTLNAAIGPQRTQIADLVRERAQEVLDSYNAGVDVLGVDIKQADPPKEVDEAFKDVSASQQDAQKYLNDANAYAQQLTAQAQGEAASFDRVYAEYRSEEHTSELQSLMRISYAVFCLKKKNIIDKKD